jgi:folate-binding protein YgfZ
MLRAGGPDAATFLQGQFSNDLRGIRPGGAVYGLWLDRKGHVLGDSHVILGGAGEFWIASITTPAEGISRHLGDHVVADDVEIADETGAWRGVSLMGEGTGAWLAGSQRPGHVFAGRRTPGENWEWLMPESEAAAAEEALSGARAVQAGEIERLRIEAAIPSVPADIGPCDLPNEGGLEEQAVSYSKGCYLGQEVMARIRSMGRVRRRLVRVRGAGAPPCLPAGLWRGERREGEIRSLAASAGGYVGLALVSSTCAAAGGRLSLSPGAAPGVEVAGGP